MSIKGQLRLNEENLCIALQQYLSGTWFESHTIVRVLSVESDLQAEGEFIIELEVLQGDDEDEEEDEDGS